MELFYGYKYCGFSVEHQQPISEPRPTMKPQAALRFVFVGALCIIGIYSQAPGIPEAVKTAIKKLQNDVQSMKASGEVIPTTIITDLQSIASEVKNTLTSAPQEAQDQFKQIQIQIDQLKAAGSVDPGEMSAIMAAFISLYGNEGHGLKGMKHQAGKEKVQF